ncbi:sensor histidine kinase [Actinoplanes sp. NBRC 103695]|uniref:sensor histidine kinase n=1 Tax=Actinoplanes sp. NBRC 103695 TaxID=3032202 RepID=UPI0024A035F6|nr:sensor histidine kinase [Actinoplanes sp. NBRC 103695]GLY93664.1 two-component sensor histidine kinase [Actinoplanes sp. NBRC 103695]
METSGRAATHEVTGPWGGLRRLWLGPTTRLTLPKFVFLRYAAPIALLGLVGLTVANAAFLQDSREMTGWSALLISVLTIGPLVVAVRNPVIAWRFAYPMLIVGAIGAKPTDAWPWAPMHIIAFLAGMLLMAFTQETSITLWATAFNIVVPFLFADSGNAYGIAVLFAAVAFLGDLVARRQRSKVQLAELAEQTELTELERARRAVLEERTRIAREMHDVVAHHMSMIAVQAETAPFRVTDLSEPARAELATIADSARSALSDMRRLLGVLRAEGQEALKAPQPGLDELSLLVDKARQSGVELSVEATVLTSVPEAVGLASYRIIQEALANAARHAPGRPVRLEARAEDERLLLVVRNEIAPDSPPPDEDGDGHGLRGMRERAELLGGTLRTGPDGTGGFRVEVSLPYRDGEEPSK